jgi:mono/diheme cytochrome c family protein
MPRISFSRVSCVLPILLIARLAAAQATGTPQLPDTPTEIYAAWCVKCHGADGSGRLAVATVKTTPRDFTNCKLATAEADTDWELITAKGGPPAGMSSEMPAFGELMQPEQVRAMVAHLRSFCKEDGWPLGNVNFPRPMFTEKAFPENEFVVAPVVSHQSGEPASVGFKSVYEQRIGRRAHAEIGVPLESAVVDERSTGIGDVSVATKYVLHTNRASTRIVSTGLEVKFPTGSQSKGLGGGTAVFEPFLAAGVGLGLNIVQGNIKYEFPTADPWGDAEFVYNTYFGRTLDTRPSAWTLAVELNGVQKDLAFTPQVRKALTRTGALAAAGGVQIPLNNRSDQPVRYVGYVLWEYLDPVRPRP